MSKLFGRRRPRAWNEIVDRVPQHARTMPARAHLRAARAAHSAIARGCDDEALDRDQPAHRHC